jgi:hypothetical protein
MNRTLGLLTAWAIVGAAALWATPAAASTGCSWVQVPGDPSVSGRLQGVAASGADQVWAVGTFVGPGVIERWDGFSWSTVTIPPAAANGSLRAVTSLASDDAWAVGNTSSAAPLAIHWDGTSWTRVPMPRSGLGNDFLRSVSASGPDDVWAGGYTSTGSSDVGLLERWNGTQWSIRSAPPSQFVYGLSALSPRNVWAVVHPGASVAVVAHWDGANWNEQSLGGPSRTLFGIVARSGTDIWAVGVDYTAGPLIVHWNGVAWTQSPTPNHGGTLFSVASSSPRRAWAVGVQRRYEPLIERWNGTEWKLRKAGSSLGALFAVTTVPGAPTIWAVGDQIERYC